MRTSVAGPHSVHAQRGCVCFGSAMSPGLAGRRSSGACVCAAEAGGLPATNPRPWLAEADRQLDVVGEWNGQIATCGRAYPRQIFGAAISVIGKDECPRPEAALHQAQDFGVERLGSVEQDQIDQFGKRAAAGWEGVSLADLHEVDEATRSQIVLCSFHLGRLELAADQMAAAIVPLSCGKIQGRDAE